MGSSGEAAPYVGPATVVIEVRGRTLMPGIHDGHTHPLAGGLVLTKPTLNYRQLDLKPFPAALRRFLARTRDQEPDVSKTKVDLTMVAGRIVHRRT